LTPKKSMPHRSAGQRRREAVAGVAPIDPLEHISQLRRLDRTFHCSV
jgi:hypothetical protein